MVHLGPGPCSCPEYSSWRDYGHDLLRERLAAIEHERWSDWQRYMHGLCRRLDDGSLVIPAELVERWERQIATPYDELSEAEKRSDREQVDRYWPLISRGGDR